MKIFVEQKGAQTGPFSLEEVRAGLASGLYQTSDLGWSEGLADWVPLSNILDLAVSSSQPITAVPPVTSGLAITSMVLGISGLLCGITAIPAVICGHIALGKIKRSGGALTGGGFALAGLITGYLSGLIIIIAVIAGLTAPMVLKSVRQADRTEAINNAKQIGLALFEFEQEYGQHPNEATAAILAEKTGKPKIEGNSSNSRFRQLFQAEIIFSEEIFYAKGEATVKPDGDIDGDQAIAPGECGFGYIENVSMSEGAPKPVAMAPFIAGSSKFEPEVFGGYAIFLWTDNSVRSYRIDRATGEVRIDGMNILAPDHPIWEGTPPKLLLPE